jgi:hypothetical protein
VREVVNSVQVDSVYIYPINGLKFDIGSLSILDRILKIEEISIRSVYSAALESIFYSSYVNISGRLQGIYLDNFNFTNLTYSGDYLQVGYSLS